MRKIGIWCLLLLMVFGTVSCGKKGAAPDSGSSGKGTEVKSPESTIETDEFGQEVVDNEIPSDLHYSGETINIVMRPRDLWVREFGLENRADSVDNQVYYRNIAVENQLGVKIKIDKRNELTNEDLSSYVYASWLGNTGDVDLVVGSAYFMAGAAVKECFTDYNDSAKMPYLKTSKPWWNQNYIHTAEVFGKLYYLIGDINLSVWDRTIVTFANLTQLEAIGKGDILDTVLNHEWTVEAMQSILKEIPFTEQDNVDGPTAGDKYALHSVKASEAWDGFYGAFRLRMMERNEDGTYNLTVSGNQKLTDASTLVHNFYNRDNVYLTQTFDDTFVDGRATFEIDVLYSGADQNYKLRSMTDKYAILPLPMYDSAQKEYGYGATAQDTYNLMGVMSCGSTDQKMMSAFLELMCSKSYEKVRPSYVEQMLKGKYLKEAKNVRVMEMIFDAVYFDPAIIYSTQLENIEWNIWRTPTRKGESVSTAWGTWEPKVKKALDDFETWYMAN